TSITKPGPACFVRTTNSTASMSFPASVVALRTCSGRPCLRVREKEHRADPHGAGIGRRLHEFRTAPTHLPHAPRPRWVRPANQPPGDRCMNRLFLWGLVVSVLIAAAALSRNNQGTPAGDLQVEVEDRNPWTHLRLNNDPGDFQFVVISDRTG